MRGSVWGLVDLGLIIFIMYLLYVLAEIKGFNSSVNLTNITNITNSSVNNNMSVIFVGNGSEQVIVFPNGTVIVTVNRNG
jgi:hypothetical protein